MKVILRSKKVLTRGRIEPRDVVISKDRIEAVGEYGSRCAAIDLGEMLIAPGIVDLHSDSIEHEIEPRPGAVFPVDLALVELDKKLAMAGITTMFHAVGFNESPVKQNRSGKNAEHVIRKICEANGKHLTVDNRIHVRLEKSAAGAIPAIRQLIAERKVDMLSIMDHTPGQGQWKNIDKWKKYISRAGVVMSENEIREFIREKTDRQDPVLLGDFFRDIRGLELVLLSHDDSSNEDIDNNAAMGITICEFPLSVETAKYARERGIASGMGAPNAVRGASQSGNVSALDLVRENVCDYFCSDYHLSSMLMSAYRLSGLAAANDGESERIIKYRELCDALGMVTETPSRLSGLRDRGRIEEGLLADLIVIEEISRDNDILPRNVLTMKSGEIVYNGLRGFRF